MTRLDAELAARGLARSRTHAAELVRAGLVIVDGDAARKPSQPVAAGAVIDAGSDGGFVSRAAGKLTAALDAFGVDPAGRVALDVGASTGGFTQVLRARGARLVVAVDVGHGQLAEPVRSDPGVVSVEGTSVRDIDADWWLDTVPGEQPPTLVTADLSFISLRHALGPIDAIADPTADLVLLVKPQFEAGRTGVRGGIVVDDRLREAAVTGVLDDAWSRGWGVAGVEPSPIRGAHGNVEVIVWFSKTGGAHPSEWRERTREVTRP